MIIDRSQRTWIIVTFVLFLIATVLYVVYAWTTPSGPSGGTWQGLLFGIVGSLLMLYAGLIGARKKVPTWRIGRATTWMKGHIWLGLLTVPLILYHSAFRWGGAVEIALWVCFIAIIVSGVYGLILQQYIPRIMSQRAPMETVYEQIHSVCHAMRNETDDLIETICGPLPEHVKPKKTEEEGGEPSKVAFEKARRKKIEPAKPGSEPLLTFYLNDIRPFLDPIFNRHSRLADAAHSESRFEQMRKRLPPDFENQLDQLSLFCEERRQLALQSRLHHWLHGWLFLHVPLSFALLALGVIHAVTAVYY